MNIQEEFRKKSIAIEQFGLKLEALKKSIFSKMSINENDKVRIKGTNIEGFVIGFNIFEKEDFKIKTKLYKVKKDGTRSNRFHDSESLRSDDFMVEYKDLELVND